MCSPVLLIGALGKESTLGAHCRWNRFYCSVLCIYMSCVLCSSLAGVSASSGIRPGDRLVEVNGVPVRAASHAEVEKVLEESGDEVTLLLHTMKPAPTPHGE